MQNDGEVRFMEVCFCSKLGPSQRGSNFSVLFFLSSSFFSSHEPQSVIVFIRHVRCKRLELVMV